MALLFSRSLIGGAIFIPVVYLHHVLVLINRIKEKRKIIIFGYIAALILMIFNFTPFLVESVSPKFVFDYWPNPGPLFHPFILMFLTYAVYGTIWLSVDSQAVHFTGAV